MQPKPTVSYADPDDYRLPITYWLTYPFYLIAILAMIGYVRVRDWRHRQQG